MNSLLRTQNNLPPELIVISQLFPQKLGEEFYYKHLPLCVIDAVFSLGIRYSTVQKVVRNFCQYTGWECFRNQRNFPPVSQQHSISDLLNIYNNFRTGTKIDFQKVANTVFKNRCRSIPRKNGPLKAETVYKFALELQKSGINYFQDLANIVNSPSSLKLLESRIRKIPGLKSGIGFNYFLMLSGNCNTAKPDRMVKRYLGWLYCSDEEMSESSAILLLKDLLYRLQSYMPSLTLRELDYAIWSFQKSSVDFGCSFATAHFHKSGELLTIQVNTGKITDLFKNGRITKDEIESVFEMCLEKLLLFLEKRDWKLNGRRIKGFVFRMCPDGILKLPDWLFRWKVSVISLANTSRVQLDESFKVFPEKVLGFKVDGSQIFKEIEEVIKKEMVD